MVPIFSSGAPDPIEHYSRTIVHDGLVYVSGQLPIDPHTGERMIDSIEEQTRQAIQNLSGILEAAGSDLKHVLKTTVYVSDRALWNRVNAVYAEFFGDHQPARAVTQATALHLGCQIEIEAIAVKRAQRGKAYG